MGRISDRITAEPVRFWAALTGLVTAIIGALVGFEIVSWTAELTGFILVVWAAIGTVFQFFFVRNKVTPTG
jgi:hypothetical protein